MNIQRWTSADGDFGAEMWADVGGDYVLFADHQQALSALEEQHKYYVELQEPQHRKALEERDEARASLTAAQARITELEKAVTTYKHRHESGGPLSYIRPDSCMCSACDQARAALSPKEPATPPEPPR